MSSVITKRLLFRIPEATIAAYEIPLTLLEGTAPNRFLRLLCEPNDYTRTKESSDSETGLQSGFNSTFATIALARIGFEVTVKDDRYLLVAAMSELAALSITSGYQALIPIEVWDYVRPSYSDVKAAIATNTEPYTIRRGIITAVESGGTWNWRRESRVLEGFKISFKSIQLEV